MPTVVPINRSPRRLAVLADALLAAGLIGESDWRGDLGTTLVAGLARFVRETSGGRGGFVPCDLVVMDNVNHAGLGACPLDDEEEDGYDYEARQLHAWDHRYEASDDLDVDALDGGFGLVIHEWREAVVGEALQGLERLAPGAGFSVMDAIESALQMTAGAVGPNQARWMVANWHFGCDTGETPEEALERLHARVPREAAEAEFRPEAVAAALSHPDVTERQREILTRANDLSGRVAAARAAELFHSDLTDEQGMGTSYDHPLPCLIRWTRDDDTRRIFDDYHATLQNGDFGDVAWFARLNVSDEDTVRRAADKLRTALELVAGADTLLALCHTPGAEPEGGAADWNPRLLPEAGPLRDESVHVTNATRGEEVLTLRRAVLLYERREFGPYHEGSEIAGSVLATVHPVSAPRGGSDNFLAGAEIGPGQCLTQPALDEMVRHLSGAPRRREVLPPEVLSCDGARMAWWSPPRHAPIFFRTRDDKFNRAVNGRTALHPPLLFLAEPGELYVWALTEARRPTGETPLCRAPYFNIYPRGLMCQGNVPLPDVIQVTDIPAWESAFFNTNFTHTNYGTDLVVNKPHTHESFWRMLTHPPKGVPLELLAVDWAEYLTPITGKDGPLTVDQVINREEDKR